MAKDLFEESEDFNPFVLKFHMLDDIEEDVSWLGAFNFLDVSPFQHFKFVIKKFRNLTSMERESAMEEDVEATNASVAIDEIRNITRGGLRKAKLVRDSTIIIDLAEIAISTFASLAHINNNGRGVLASQYSAIVQN